MTLVFVNTRSQAEFMFQALWSLNEDGLPSPSTTARSTLAQRRRVEAAMAAGELKAVVCTSTLDLGIDWGDVDLVINVGAPKGASRLMQRIGRANHRLDEPSRALLVPSNRFEVLECRAAVDAAHAGAQDTAVAREGALDVLCQHILGMACAAPFAADDLFAEIISAEPYAAVDRADLRRGRSLSSRTAATRSRLRPFRQDQADQGWAMARRQRPRGADLPDERRHHRRGDGAEGAPRAGRAKPSDGALHRPARAAGACSASSRKGSSNR